MEKADRIELQVEIRAPIHRVWSAITSADEIARWFGDIAEVDLRPGGAALFGWSSSETFHAIVEIVEEPSRFAYSWATNADEQIGEGPSTRVEFSLVASGEDTIVTVVETGFAALPDDRGEWQLNENTKGWKSELKDLVELLGV